MSTYKHFECIELLKWYMKILLSCHKIIISILRVFSNFTYQPVLSKAWSWPKSYPRSFVAMLPRVVTPLISVFPCKSAKIEIIPKNNSQEIKYRGPQEHLFFKPSNISWGNVVYVVLHPNEKVKVVKQEV